MGCVQTVDCQLEFRAKLYLVDKHIVFLIGLVPALDIIIERMVLL